jgi:hypothetical protein
MSIAQTEIRIKGKNVYVPAAQVQGRTIIANGRWLKMATVQDEDLAEGEIVADPESLVSQLQKMDLDADIFSFPEKLPNTTPRYGFHFEWDNLAVIPITTFSAWWKDRAESSVQRAVRKAAKQGVVVKVSELDDAFVRGIVNINNETPIRQGRAFWHFQKSFEDVKRENSTYAERNTFLGAYYEGELIGFMRITSVDKVASVIQLLNMMKHLDKRPANALIAKAVEVCEQKGMSHLMYCNYVYNDPKSSLTEFKRRNGFEQVLVPRYFIPLTLRGKIAMKSGLHRGLAKQLPKAVVEQLLKARSLWNARKLKTIKETV